MSENPNLVEKNYNNFNLEITTKNGTGSALSNFILSKVIFRLGAAITTKNLFPSNIQGFPTWYYIRLSKDGFYGFKKKVDVLLNLYPETLADDEALLVEPGIMIIDQTSKFEIKNPNHKLIKLPLIDTAKENFGSKNLREKMTNMIYVGVLSQFLKLDCEILYGVLQDQFANKSEILESNKKALELGINLAKNYETENKFEFPYEVREDRFNQNRIYVEGNEATALGAVYAGCQVVAWYPITPSTSVVESYQVLADELLVDKQTGLKNFACLQMEDELASAAAVLGAGWAGVRTMTATSGPGLSLMNEMLGLAYYSEIPGVFVDVQRVGPSTGMPTRTQQGDILTCVFASHGDTEHPLIIPTDPYDCFIQMGKAFELAEEFQTAILFPSDLDIGMNYWSVPQIPKVPAFNLNRGKILGPGDLDKMEKFYRYIDTDLDAVPYRTIPGKKHAKAAYFNRGSGHNKWGVYTEKSSEYKEVLDRIGQKIKNMIPKLPQPTLVGPTDASLGIICYGSSYSPCLEFSAHLSRLGFSNQIMVIRSYPFASSVGEFVKSKKKCLMVEQNRDGQMLKLLKLNDLDFDRISSLKFYDGMPLSAENLVEGFLQLKKEGKVW